MRAAREIGPVSVVGNLTLDDTFTPSGSFVAAPGGDALYAALGVRWWGLPVTIVSRVGEDYPQDHLQRMEAAGIGIADIKPMPGPTVHYRVTYEGDARVFEHLTNPERLDELSPTGTDLEAIETARWVHVAAMPIDRQAEAVRKARALGLPYSLDPHEEYVAGYTEVLTDLIRGGVFLPSELETGLLFPGLNVDQALDRLAAIGARAAAVKHGVDGSFVQVQGRSWHVSALSVPAVDPTGAGDAYCGGFVAGFLLTGSALAAAACGTVAAGHIIQGFGAFHSPPPKREWMDESLSTLLQGRFAGEGDRALALLRRRA